MSDQEQVKKIKKITVGVIFSWIFGIIFILAGLGSLASSVASAIIYLIVGVYILPPLNKKIIEKSGFQLSGVLTVVFVIVMMFVAVAVSPSKPSASTPPPTANQPVASNQAQSNDSPKTNEITPQKPKEGDVLEGIDRKEIEDTYETEKSKSSVKADAYIKTLEGKKVVWVGTIKDVSKDFSGSYNNISFKMGVYNNYLADKLNKYSDLEKGQTIKITGKIDRVTTFIGTDVYLVADNVEVIK